MSSNWSYYVAVSVCVMLSVVVYTTYRMLLPKDSAENRKLLAIISVFSFVAALTAYSLANYQFAGNPTYMIQFLLLIVMLVILPATLISASISTITISNLRDTLAAGN